MFLLPFLGPEVAQAITGQAPGWLNEGHVWNSEMSVHVA